MEIRKHNANLYNIADSENEMKDCHGFCGQWPSARPLGERTYHPKGGISVRTQQVV